MHEDAQPRPVPRGGALAATGVVAPGPAFLTPPKHRLFAALDDMDRAVGAARELAAAGLSPEDLWAYEGEDGARRLDRRTRFPHHLVLRLAQMIWTTDHEYGDILRYAVRAGGAVLAIRVPEGRYDVVRAILRRHGARAISITSHWNYLPPEPEDDVAA